MLWGKAVSWRKMVLFCILPALPFSPTIPWTSSPGAIVVLFSCREGSYIYSYYSSHDWWTLQMLILPFSHQPSNTSKHTKAMRHWTQARRLAVVSFTLQAVKYRANVGNDNLPGICMRWAMQNHGPMSPMTKLQLRKMNLAPTMCQTLFNALMKSWVFLPLLVLSLHVTMGQWRAPLPGNLGLLSERKLWFDQTMFKIFINWFLVHYDFHETESMNHIKTPELPSKQVLGSPHTDPLTDNEPASQSCQPRAHLITLTNARHQTWSTISFDGNFPFFLSVWKATESYCLRTPGEYLSKHSLYTRRNWSTERLRDMPDDTANYV